MTLTTCALTCVLATCTLAACGRTPLDLSDLGPDAGSLDAADGNNTQHDASAPPDGGTDAAATCTVTPCVTQLAAGPAYTCALMSDHTVRCWGANGMGQLGSGTLDGGFVTPSPVATPTPVVGIDDAVQIAAGGEQANWGMTCAIRATNALECWGEDRYGDLGRDGGTATFAPTPAPNAAPVAALANTQQIAVGGTFACALGGVDGVSCWGNDSEGELGRTTVMGFDGVPAPTQPPRTVLQVSCGANYTCVLDGVGAPVECWGSRFAQATGQPPTDGGPDPTGGIVPGVAGATQISAGAFAACAVTQSGQVFCWGDDSSWELGRGEGAGRSPTWMPAAVALPAGAKATQVAVGSIHACALLDDGHVYCWGANDQGELGSGRVTRTGTVDPDHSAVPVRVQGLTGVIQVVAGWSHTCALLAGGSVVCWGSDDNDQLSASASSGQGISVTPVLVAF